MVLSRLGFSEARIVECLTEAIGIKNGWENALEWVSMSPNLVNESADRQMWFHLSEDEWPAPGEHAPPPGVLSVLCALAVADPLVQTKASKW